MAIIEARALTKEFRVFQRRPGVRGAFLDLVHRRYQALRAVDGIDFRIEAGERVGYIGPNGAGKSTTIKMLAGILVPSGGSVAVAGLDPHRERRRCVHRIGAVFGQRSQLWWDLAPLESLGLLASVYGVSRSDLERRLAELEEPLELTPNLRTPVRKLSLGQKMRFELAAALLHRPDVLFLDEPTIGLDLMAKEGIRRFLRKENRERGTTLILTTHDLSDIEELCERVIVIDKGKLLFDGPLAELKVRMGGSGSLLFQLLDGAGSLEVLRGLIPDQPVTWTAEDSGAFRATFARGVVSKAEVIRRVIERFEVADIAVVDVKIEDVVRKIYAGENSGGT
jgi:viologen exporter family transport system ATP-binding protein